MHYSKACTKRRKWTKLNWTKRKRLTYCRVQNALHKVSKLAFPYHSITNHCHEVYKLQNEFSSV